MTGGARGPGRAHALELAGEGADVILTDICAPIGAAEYQLASADDLAETVKLVEGLGRRCVGIQADARSLSAMKAAVKEGVDTLGRVDIAVINHGIAAIASWDAEENVINDVLDTNLKGVLYSAQAVIPYMIEQGDGGSILMTSSSTALRPVQGMAVYAAAKAGVLGLARALSADLAEHRIRVNAICPGTVASPMTTADPVLSKVCGLATGGTLELADFALRSMNLLPYPYMESRDLARAALFLLTDDGKYVTGITLPIDIGAVNQPYGVPAIATEVVAAARQAH